MRPLESARIPIMELTDTRTVYGSEHPVVTIPSTVLRYSDHPLNGHPVDAECRAFHAKLVEVGDIPRALQQRYGVNPFETYCSPQTHPASYIQDTELALLRDAMDRAVDTLLTEKSIPVDDYEEQDVAA